MKITSATFVKSIFNIIDKPFPYLPEFAFVGRSNVGKSSLINSLTKRKKLAHISNTPGKTRSINYFKINDLFYLVDLPGYGFAKISKSERKKWKIMIENYLLQSKELRYLFVLTDIRHGPQELDLQLIEWLKINDISFKIIATKADKLSKNKIYQNLTKLYKPVVSNLNDIFIFSAISELGRQELLQFIIKNSK